MGLLVYGMANGNYDKWKSLLTKIMGNHASINEHVFDASRLKFYEMVQKDNKDFKDKAVAYYNKDKIEAFVQK